MSPPVVDADRVRADVAEILAEDVGTIGADDNLLDLGLDSVRLMLLAQRWQDAGIDIDLMSLVEEPTLTRWQELLADAARRIPAVPAPGADTTVRLSVVRVEQLTPRVMRVTLGGAGVERYAGTGPGTHAELRPAGSAGSRPVGVRYHGGSAEIDVDVVVHDDGVLGPWAAEVRPGVDVELAGPVPGPDQAEECDWTLLVVDQTAFPVLEHRVERASAGSRVLAVVVVADAAEEQLVHTAADLQIRWVHAGSGTAGAVDEVMSMLPGDGRGRSWVAGEEGLVTAVTAALEGVPALAGRSLAEVYWRRGLPSAG
ncbi:MAG: hypothetical protein ABS81_03115 [Pseudonocardia sp. SCN 72-86]|nr:MAG: hypothetical protein ABS81_03115 [Pseudonocardia sp. SCN 72-86]